ncbi:MAG: hypothetical protein LKM33_03565 [Bacteroidales bacterium]|jgi:hypothetical protein|nr:hypothetical protein [Bacteroidales bacterium]
MYGKTIEQLINSVPPFQQKSNNFIDAMSNFGGWLMSGEGDVLGRKIVKQLLSINDSLIKCYQLFLQGQTALCYKRIEKLLYSKREKYPIFKTTKIPKGKFYYRMRPCDNEYLYSSQELFHIPFEERNKVANCRFSLSGTPCLYIGSSTYLCWEELNRPKIETANVVGIKTLRDLQLIDLRMPTKISDISDYFRIPLIVACSVKVTKPIFPFKPEYIIPQAVLHSLISHNNDKGNSSGTKYSGIIYYSTHLGDEAHYFPTKKLYENIVIPTVNNTINPSAEKIFENGYCPVLCNSFEITDVVSLNKLRMTGKLQQVKTARSLKQDENCYEITELHTMEQILQKTETHKLVPNKYFKYDKTFDKNY